MRAELPPLPSAIPPDPATSAAVAAPVVVDVDCITHGFGRQTVVDGLSFSLARGAIACLLGPSGCGKTTVLRAIAGFEPLRAGQIRIDGQVVSSAGFGVPPEHRRVGMVFQDYALFPHLDVAANVGFGLAVLPRADRAARVREVLALVGLPESGGKYPHELSGGQQQRVALARALAPRPALLLLDEPFSNLDVDLRERLGQEVRAILKAQGTTAILVTHDQQEAFAMADEIGVMFAGAIAQWGSAHALYHRPATRFVAGFVGQGVLLPGRALGPDTIAMAFGLGMLRGREPLALLAGDEVDVLIRPDDIVHDERSPLRAVVTDKAFRGAQILYTLRVGGGGNRGNDEAAGGPGVDAGARLLALMPSHHDVAIGTPLGIRVEAVDVVAFPRAAPASAL